MLDQIEEHGFGTVEDYQQFHGLKVDGELGPVTERSLRAPRICGHPDRMSMSNVKPWKKRHLKWKIDGSLPRITQSQFSAAAKKAFTFWSNVCGLTFEETRGNDADIVITTGRIDGPFGTLAWSELSDGTDRRKTQKYDSKEPWVISLNPPRNYIGLIHVLCHEVGHVIGMVHEAFSGIKALMNPTYDPAIYKPQTTDENRATGMYGPPIQTPGGTNAGEDKGDMVWVALQVPRSQVLESKDSLAALF